MFLMPTVATMTALVAISASSPVNVASASVNAPDRNSLTLSSAVYCITPIDLEEFCLGCGGNRYTDHVLEAFLQIGDVPFLEVGEFSHQNRRRRRSS